jgi:hypothetical protein
MFVYIKRIKIYEIGILLGIILFVLFIYHFPEYYAAANTPKGMVYLGQNSYFDPWDVNYYVSSIHYGQLHGIALPNLYTNIKNPPIYIFSVLTLAGYFFKTIDPFVLYQLFSIFTGFLLIVTIFLLTRTLGFSTRFSFYTTILVCLSGGLGFLLSSNNLLQIDEAAYSIYSTFQKPHEAIAIILYSVSLIMFYQNIISQKPKLKKFLIPFLLIAIVLFIYPYLILSFFLITFIFLIICRNKNIPESDYAYLFFFCIPLIVVELLMANQFFSNPTFNGITVNQQSNFLSDALGLGVPFLILVYQFLFLPKSKLKLFLSLWIIVSAFLGLMPIGPGKIFFRGIYFPIILLCVLSIKEFTVKFNIKKVYWIYGLFGIIIIASSFIIFTKRLTQLNQGYADWVYLSANEYKIFNFLNENTPEGSSIIALYQLDNLIPAYSHNTVYFGHMLQTPDAQYKFQAISVFFYYPDQSKILKKFLAINHISYVVYGIKEKALLSTNPHANSLINNPYPYLKLIYSNSDIKIYSTNIDSQ